jgi:hypothetical protein
MILEAVRLLADVLADSGHGVNASATALHAAGYFDGSDPVPAAVTVGDETRDLAAAIGRNLDVTRSVTVFYLGTVSIPPGDGIADIGALNYLHAALRLGARIDITSDAAEVNTREIAYFVRAMMHSVRWWFRDDRGPGVYQRRNGIALLGPVAVTPGAFSPTATSPRNTFGIEVVASFQDAVTL